MKVVSRLSAIACLSITSFACVPQTGAPNADSIFEPNPNHNFQANTGVVAINGLDALTVCYTTDGSDPMYNGGTCSGGTTAMVEGAVELDCGSDTEATTLRTIKLAYEWSGAETAASATYILDCRPPAADTDDDGIPDTTDNCPTISNADQADADSNGVGDACEGSTEPDADGDTKPDLTDNCVNVFNPSQGDQDGDGIGNVCDSTPQGTPAVLWANDNMLDAWQKWESHARCQMNSCNEPSGLGNWSATCANGGSVSWAITLSGLAGKSTFTYSNCEFTVNDSTGTPRTLTITGSVSGVFNSGGSTTGAGTTGTLNITGDYEGTIEDHIQITSRVKSGGYYLAGCTDDPLTNEVCASGGTMIRYDAPAWTCYNGICPVASTPLTDTDGDGVHDIYDNCPNNANSNQADSDFDGAGNACDSSSNPDEDGDGVPNVDDNCPLVSNSSQADSDGDGIGNACEVDTDSDGVSDDTDNCVDVANSNQADSDSDGIGDACDAPSWFVIKQKDGGRCLQTTGTSGWNVTSTTPCNASSTTQRWELVSLGNNAVQLKNGNGQCLSYEGRWVVIVYFEWSKAVTCNTGDAKQKYYVEDYTQGGLDASYPTRLKNGNLSNACLYTNNLSDVYQTAGSCDLGGTENYRKWGIYPEGNFGAAPLRQADFPL